MASRLTNFYVDYNIEDTTAKADAVFATNDSQQYFTEISECVNEHAPLTFPHYTFEHNYNILNGDRTELENDSNNSYTYVNNSSTINTIIFVESIVRTITATSSSVATHSLASYTKTLSLAAGTYYLNGCPEGGSDSKYYVSATVNGTTYKDYGEGTSFTLSAAASVVIGCNVAANYIVEDLVFTPTVTTVAPPYVTEMIPYFNKLLSGNDGTYSTNPKITITFSREHASFAFRVLFYDSHPLEMKLTFYDLRDALINIYTFPITENDVTIKQDVYGYAKIVVEFTKALPGQYIKFSSFLFGIWITWDETNVQNANIVQQVDRLSKNLAIETLTFNVIDVGSELNLGNIEGMHKYFQTNQPLLPYEVITNEDGTQKRIELGKYYLKTYSENSNLGKMSAQSYLGIMDDVTFYGGEIYEGKRAGEVIDEIFDLLNLTNYTIDEETYNTLLYGTITPKSCRKALNEILFATNSICNAHDTENVIIKKSSPVRRPDINKGAKFSTTVTKNKYVYGVEIKYTTYVQEDEPKEIAKGTYGAGTHIIYFTQPHKTLSINTGTIDEQNIYSVKFTVPEESEVVITGYAFTTTTNIARHVQSKLQAGEGETIESYSTTLCNDITAKVLAQKILTYLNYNLTIKLKWLADNNDMGDRHVVRNPVDEFNDYVGIFTKRSLDLTGGFIDTAEMAGQVIKDSIYQYARSENYELYSGEEGLI